MHSPADLPRIVKNECVDRFWQAIDAYCRPVTDEDIKFLEEQINKTEMMRRLCARHTDTLGGGGKSGVE